MENFLNLILQPLKGLLEKLDVFLPNFLAMLVIMLVGILLALIIRKIFVRFLLALSFDSWSDRMGFTKLIRKGDMWGKPSTIFGALVFWLLIIITLMSALSALQVLAVDHLVDQFFSYMPRLVSAAMILVIGYVIAGFIRRAVLIAGANSGFHYAKIFADTVHTLLIVLILAMVMEQMQIAPGIVLAAFSIIFGGIVTALAIAFGVGGIDAARRVIEKDSASMSEENRDEIEHL